MTNENIIALIDQMIDRTRGTVENYYDELREHKAVVSLYRAGEATNAQLATSMRSIEETKRIVEERNPGKWF
jgi:hypothetical protein